MVKRAVSVTRLLATVRRLHQQGRTSDPAEQTIADLPGWCRRAYNDGAFAYQPGRAVLWLRLLVESDGVVAEGYIGCRPGDLLIDKGGGVIGILEQIRKTPQTRPEGTGTR